MLISELPSIFTWWFLFFLIGIITLPLTTQILHNFFDKGYIFSKVLGTIFLSYSVWILASLKLVPFDTFNIFFILGIFLGINIYLSFKSKTLTAIKSRWKIFLFEEILFLTGLTFWSFIRAHEPSIHGLEKYMDFGFINSILRLEYFPPKDLWLSGETINYYYFGHLIAAVLTKLSFLDSTITYNLILATLFGLTFTCSFSIGSNLYYFFTNKRHPETFSGSHLEIPNQVRSDKWSVKIIIVGLLAAILVSLSGNLHTIYAFFENYNTDNPIPFWTLKPDFNFSGYWYPNATRFIPLTIHEFPLYSFVVADLHGHVLNIPIVLLTIAILVSIYFKEKIQYRYYILFGFLVALMLMTNVLDGPIYILLFSLIILFKFKLAAFKPIFLIILLSAIFSLPFWLNFKPFSSGIGLICSPQFLIDTGKFGPFIFEANHCSRSPFWMLAILYGFFYFLFYGYYIKVRKHLSSSDNLILIFVLFSTIAILIPEIFYVKDIYPAHYRANTVFKFGYQAFIVLSLASSYMIIRLISNIKNQKSKLLIFKIIYLFFLSLFFILVSIYPYFAIRSYYGELKTYHGLDGLQYLNKLYPPDYRAIVWIKNHIFGQPVILEAVGESYTDYARVSSNTGIPTVIGWPVHEWLWRGSPDEGTKRQEEVKLIYEDPDIYKTRELLQKYNVEYVFIGILERQKYPNLVEDKFSQLGNIIFQDSQTTIYELAEE